MVDNYITEDFLREAIRDPSLNDSNVLAQCLSASAREIDKDCGRFFYADAAATTNLFAAESQFCCELRDADMGWDFYETTSLVVKTDTNGDRTYDATWVLGTDFILEPINRAKGGIRGWPYETIRAVGNRQFPLPSFTQPYPVQVAAKWGWEAIPAGIITASVLMSNAMYKRPEAPFGVAGFDAFGAVRVRSDPLYISAIAPFIRTSRIVA